MGSICLASLPISTSVGVGRTALDGPKVYFSTSINYCTQRRSKTAVFSIPLHGITSDGIDNDVQYRAGADFFWRPTTNLQLTATINPDFGIAESDDVVINLSATETFFPEKRALLP